MLNLSVVKSCISSLTATFERTLQLHQMRSLTLLIERSQEVRAIRVNEMNNNKRSSRQQLSCYRVNAQAIAFIFPNELLPSEFSFVQAR